MLVDLGEKIGVFGVSCNLCLTDRGHKASIAGAGKTAVHVFYLIGTRHVTPAAARVKQVASRMSHVTPAAARVKQVACRCGIDQSQTAGLMNTLLFK